MIAEKMVRLGEKRSSIRDAYEYGRKRAALIGEENVFDFSLGNPHVPAPPGVRRAIRQLLEQEDDIELFGYTPAQGLLKTRQAIAADLNARFGTSFGPENLYLTCGAAAGIRIITQALTVPGDEYIVFRTPAENWWKPGRGKRISRLIFRNWSGPSRKTQKQFS